MGTLIMIPPSLRPQNLYFGVMLIEHKRVLGPDGCVYGFGEAPDFKMNYETAMHLYHQLIEADVAAAKEMTLYIYSPDECDGDIQALPVVENYYMHDALWDATYPHLKQYRLLPENH